MDILHQLKGHLTNSVPSSNGACILYAGRRKTVKNTTYGYIDKTVQGTRYRYYAHQVALMSKMDTFPLPDTGCEGSHLCHNSLCINPHHLSFEPHSVNNSRKLCVNENTCFGHGMYPMCDLQYRIPGGGLNEVM